jgi:fatty acid desaturase
MKALYRGAQAYVSLARLLSAAFYFAIAVLLIGFALWLAFAFGENWILAGIAILVGLQGAATGVKAAEIFLSTRPPERDTQRQERPPSSRRNQDRPA